MEILIKKIPHTSGLVLNTRISEVENKMPNTSNLVTPTVLGTKFGKVEIINKLAAESFAATLKEGDLVNKTDFDNKLTSFNRQINLIETKKLEVQKKLNSLITNDYNFFLGTIYFISNYRSQNTFLFQTTLDALELKKIQSY